MRSFLQQVIVNDVLQGIDFRTYTIEMLVKHIGKQYGLAIILVPRPTLGLTEYGYWLKGPVHDFIFYECDTAKVHQEHIIMHELGHILLGHETYRVTSESTAFDAVGLARAIMRETSVELEAEALAVVMQQEIARRIETETLAAHETTTPGWSELIESLT